MRSWAFVLLVAMPLLLGAWTLSSESGWNPRGRAVVKTPDGMSHVVRGSWCNFGPHAGRLRFGAKSFTEDPSSYLSIVVRELNGAPAVLDIEDGVLRLAPNLDIAVLGTAHVRERPVRRGTFVLFKHKGGGVIGKARYTGSWNCR